MNNSLFRISFFSSLLFLLTFISCKKDDNSSSSSNNLIQTTIDKNVTSGTWRITKYNSSGKDETSHFTGYNFDFGISGVLSADNGTTIYSGFWDIKDSNSNDDSLDDLDFYIFFNLTNDFEDLNDDWDIISQSASKIELKDVSGGNGGTDYLTFEKN